MDFFDGFYFWLGRIAADLVVMLAIIGGIAGVLAIAALCERVATWMRRGKR